LPARLSRVVPLSTMAPASRLEKPATRVYSSPKPTQPDSNTIGDSSARPQNRVERPGRSAGAGDGDKMFDVILYQPEIPPNTGNIIRLCANTGARLHLVHPLGFVMDDRELRRAGLDYHEWATVQEHATLDECLAGLGGPRLWACSTRGRRRHVDTRFRPDDALLFGPESRGLPDEVLERLAPEQLIRLPMRPGNRSLNLSNAVAVVAYEAWRQQDFTGGQ